MSTMMVHNLRCEYKVNPLGLDVRHPRLSWQLASTRRGAKQTAYHIQVAPTEIDLEKAQNLLWDSGKVGSAHSLHIAYAGLDLASAQRCYWRVMAWDGDDEPTAWSSPAWWEMGLLGAQDWQARWIEPDWEEDPKAFNPCPHLRRAFSLSGKIAFARVYITSHGLYELTLNGQAATEDVFTPGFTAYEKRLQYQVYDVTPLLDSGENVIGVILGDGWWRGKVGVASVRNAYGTRLALLAQLHVIYEDGSDQWVLSDDEWKAAAGPILKSDMKDGEVYDARLEMPGWDAPGFNDSAWQGVQIADYGFNNLVASNSVPVRRKEEITPIEIIHTPAGETVVDLGQNLAGRVRLRVSGPAGTTITLRHGEALDEHGNFTMKNLDFMNNRLLQQVTYTLKGEDEEIYEPRFTFHGFRYVKVEGFPGEPSVEHFTGMAIYSDMTPTGSFTCSNPMINQLQHNITWSQKSNFLDIPTDCPQRERAGWTGDAQIFVRTGSFIMDTATFFTKWLQDLAAEQRRDGLVTNLVPNAFSQAGGFFARLEGSAGWGDAAVIVPWTLYQCYGDTRILEQQYASAKGWVDYMAGRARESHWARKLEPSFWLNKARREHQPYIWDTNYHWGEWLEPGTGQAALAGGVLARLVFGAPSVATAYLAYSSGRLAEMARVLGKDKDAEHYQTLSDKVKAAYVAEFVRPDGRIKPDKQASYVRALAFDLLPEALRPKAAQRLVELVRKNGTHLGTGFLSTPFLCHVLGEAGYPDVAYDLLNQQTIPSWLYPITKGATTIWESWDGIKPDGSVFGSLNHYSYGAVGSWLYQVVAGIEIDPAQPGYKHFFIQPNPGGGLTFARATYDSMYGPISSFWQLVDNGLRVVIDVPPNTTATVRLPKAALGQITESGQPLEEGDGIHNLGQNKQTVWVDVGAGHYEFFYPFSKAGPFA
ncbi:MAG: glycoside hydrolase family 78 protein [Anaerolineae bacterium]|nr:glycoside hydrolase family 78 protein [Anaerolineae bacterium]